MKVNEERAAAPQRRAFLRLGGLLAAGAVAGCASGGAGREETVRGRVATDAESRAVWKQGKGQAYAEGFRSPGVSPLIGPYDRKPGQKVKFPDPDKYKDTERIPSMCQLCSTVCGIIGHVKDGRIIKVEGNPNDPNSQGRLCARGQAALNHQYHPERLLYPLRPTRSSPSACAPAGRATPASSPSTRGATAPRTSSRRSSTRSGPRRT
ncbi:MAG: hypothetical protein ACYS26_16105 [Planctomycetota bacterium]